ncbi:hypothetical protein EKK58_04320 [Candidatus Dependentiae bacterium]|nr:MAG: hypothetical protein EKK58_04320 [Candidatus Dependentiae bacterium]
MSNNTSTEDENYCVCNCLDFTDDFWKKYKHHSGKVSIGISILGGVGAVLSGVSIVASSIVIGVTNVAIFFSGLAYEKLNNQAKQIIDENISLQNDKNELVKRLTVYNFPQSITSQSNTPQNISTSTSPLPTPFNTEIYFNNSRNLNEPLN